MERIVVTYTTSCSIPKVEIPGGNRDTRADRKAAKAPAPSADATKQTPPKRKRT